MLHYLETAQFAPDGKEGHWRDAFWDAFANLRVPSMRERGLKLAGVWQTPIGAGHGNEFSFLYALPDLETWTRFVQDESGLTVDPALRSWRAVAADFVEACETRLLLPSPGHDLTILGRHDPGTSLPAGTAWLYEMEFTRFKADGLSGRWRQDYWPEFRERLFPTLGRLGVQLVGAWEMAPGSGMADEHCFLYRTGGFTGWERFIDATVGASKDPVLRQRRGEMWVWREHWYTKLLVPASGHEHSVLRRELE